MRRVTARIARWGLLAVVGTAALIALLLARSAAAPSALLVSGDGVAVTPSAERAPRVALVEAVVAARSPGSPVLIFPDGERRGVTFRGRRPVGDLDPDQPISAQLEGLFAAAQAGDGAAADAVATALQYCADAYTTPGDLENALGELDRTGHLAIPGPSSKIEAIGDPALRRLRAEQLREQSRRCGGVTAAQVASAPRWREQALRAGFIDAWQNYAGSLGATEAAVDAWHSAWMAGSVPALFEIGARYARGVNPQADGTPDYTQAYAFKLLHLQLQEASSGEAPSQTRRMIVASLQQDLERTGALLNPQQWEAAVERARELLDGNQRCCIRP